MCAATRTGPGVYPYAPLASHVIGYMGLILDTQEAEYKAAGYLSNETRRPVRSREEHGVRAARRSGRGRVRGRQRQPRSCARSVASPPTPGKDIQLTIDMKVQQYAERLLETQLRNRRQTDDASTDGEEPELQGPARWCGEAQVHRRGPEGGRAVVLRRQGRAVRAVSRRRPVRWWSRTTTTARSWRWPATRRSTTGGSTISLTSEKFKQLFPTPARTPTSRSWSTAPSRASTTSARRSSRSSPARR